MILLDFETTSLHDFTLAPLDHQPEILEAYLVKLDASAKKVIGELEFMCKPRNPVIPEEVTKITGLRWEDVKDKKGFPFYLPKLVDFFLGETTMVGHNLAYDHGVLKWELIRMGKEFAFPWPHRQLCTVEISQHWKQKFFKLGDLYEYLFGKRPSEKLHRAKADTHVLLACVREMMKRDLWPK